MSQFLFLLAYLCSGFAGLVYEVTWTRLLTMYLGHSTAAATTVVAAFMGGLAGGAALGGRVAARLTRRQALLAYAALEAIVAALALTLRLELHAVVPLLSRTYANGAPGLLFPVVRVLTCLALLLVPALLLGATFPMAVRWFVRNPNRPGRDAGALYFANTSGAALGAASGGFLLIPMLGLFGTTMVGVAAGAVAIAITLAMTRAADREGAADATVPADPGKRSQGAASPGGQVAGRTKVLSGGAVRSSSRTDSKKEGPGQSDQWWLVAAVLACSGFATLMYEIAWMRVFAMTIGPSTYAFAWTLMAIIAATACGSWLGTAIAGRVRSPAAPLLLSLTAAGMAAAWASSAAGMLPRSLIDNLRASPQGGVEFMLLQSLRGSGVMIPAVLALGVAFPLALELASRRDGAMARRLGGVYAVNTIAAMAGALFSGFVALPLFGLYQTLRLTAAVLIGASLLVGLFAKLSRTVRFAGLATLAAIVVFLAWSRPWDRELLASGGYKYARYAIQTLEPEEALKAGTWLYYRDGAVATVSVKRLAGITSLAINGKVDASTSADMLTQKALAHLPLLLHENARDVCIIGLGSGVTLASALVHPVTSVDMLELSPEVVEAAGFFAAQNRNALDDPRTHLIVGDGRSHILLTTRKYDVIISEPSNPWMAGVAALFTEEFFSALRDHLAPDGILCQWVHTYDISEGDLRSLTATFASAFPDGTMWLVGGGDLLLVGSADALDQRLGNIQRNWQRPAVAGDLAEVGAADPFAFYSLFVGGGAELRRYSAGAPLQTDDRMALEFSGPRAIYSASTANENVAALRALLDPRDRPSTVARAFAEAGGAEWRDRGTMMLKAENYATAYQDYATALARAPKDLGSMDGLARAAVGAHAEVQAVELLKSMVSKEAQDVSIRVALSRLLAATGRFEEATAVAREAGDISPDDPAVWEQLASIFSDLGDGPGLRLVVDILERVAPSRPRSKYYAAASQFIDGNLQPALRLAQEAVALDMRYAPAQNLLGLLHASLSQPEEARIAFQAALRLDPRDSATYTNLGLLELSVHRPREAAGFFLEALSISPQSEAAREGLARARAQGTGERGQ